MLNTNTHTIMTTPPVDYNQSVTEEKLFLNYREQSNLIVVKGKSTGLEVLPAYNQMIQAVKLHFQNSYRLTCYFNYSIINATTTKLLFNLFNQLAEEQTRGHKISIYWIVEEGDEDLIDIGLDYKNHFNLNFQITVK